MEIVFGIIASLVAGTFSSMGMGGGGIMIIYFSLFTSIPQLTAQGINVIFFIPIALIAVIIYHRKKLIDWRIVLPFAGFGIISSLAGTFLAEIIGGDILSKIFGVLLLVMGARQLFARNKKSEKNSSEGQK